MREGAFLMVTGTAVDVVTGEVMPPAQLAYRARDTFGILTDAVDLAAVIANTDMVPTGLRGRADAVVAVILAGHELGLGPMQSLQTIDLIQGRPALSPEGMRALVLSAGHGLDVESGDDYAMVSGHRREWADPDRWRSFGFTLEDAKRAGLTQKENWVKYPRDMLIARATGRACRAIFADVIRGLSYTGEEIESFASTPPDAMAGGQTRTRGRGPSVEAAADGAASPSLTAAPPTDTGPDVPASLTDVAALEARLDKLSFRDRDAFKAWRRGKKWNWPPASAAVLAEMAAEVTKLETAAAEERETYAQDTAPVGSPID